jgi:hypothetical protein
VLLQYLCLSQTRDGVQMLKKGIVQMLWSYYFFKHSLRRRQNHQKILPHSPLFASQSLTPEASSLKHNIFCFAASCGYFISSKVWKTRQNRLFAVSSLLLETTSSVRLYVRPSSVGQVSQCKLQCKVRISHLATPSSPSVCPSVRLSRLPLRFTSDCRAGAPKQVYEEHVLQEKIDLQRSLTRPFLTNIFCARFNIMWQFDGLFFLNEFARRP